MASSSSLSLSLQSSSGGLGHGVLHRPYYSSSPFVVRLQQPKSRGLKKFVVAASYHDKASSSAGHGDDGIVTSVLLRQQVDDAAVAGELRAARSTKGRADPSPPMGSSGKPTEGGGGGKIHAAAAKGGQPKPAPPGGLPAEGSGGQGGHIH